MTINAYFDNCFTNVAIIKSSLINVENDFAYRL